MSDTEMIGMANGKMVPQSVPDGWEFVSELHGHHDRGWFVEFHSTKNKDAWDRATTGRDYRIVLAATIGMQWFDRDGSLIPQSQYWADTVYVMIRKIG